MKDIKTLMIGFLLATCMFLLIGADSNDSQIGRFQSYGMNSRNYLLDTSTGELFYINTRLDYWKQIVKPYQMVKDEQIKDDASDDKGFKK